MIALILGGVSYQKMRGHFSRNQAALDSCHHLLPGLESQRNGRRDQLPPRTAIRGSQLCRAYRIAVPRGHELHQSLFQLDYSIDAAQSELTSLAYSVIRASRRSLSTVGLQVRRFEPAGRPALRRERLARSQRDSRSGLLHRPRANRQHSRHFVRPPAGRKGQRQITVSSTSNASCARHFSSDGQRPQ